MRYDAVLLDMDGTVLDTLEDLTDAVNAALRQFGLPEVGADRARASLGHGALWLIGHCVPEGSPEELTARVLEWYRPYYLYNLLQEYVSDCTAHDGVYCIFLLYCGLWVCAVPFPV